MHHKAFIQSFCGDIVECYDKPKSLPLNLLVLCSTQGIHDDLFCSDVVEFLLSQGCHVNHTSKSGRSALWKAAQSGQQHITQLLLSHGATVNIQNRVGQSVLFDCIRTSHRITVDLVNAGIDLGLRDVEGNNVLHAAAMLGKTRAVLLFMEHGDEDIMYAVNEYGNTPLHNAAMHDRLASTAALLNCSDRYDLHNHNGQSALYLAMVHKHERIVKLLHYAGATLSSRELNMYRDFEAHKYEEKFKFFEWAYAFFNTPLLLSNIARVMIRSHLNDSVSKAVPRLPLPTMLKRFLLYDDLVHDDAITKCLDAKDEGSNSISDSDGEDEIVCDICEQLLSVEPGSTWFKCTACDDYDLCKSCRNNQAHVEHRTQLHVYNYQGPHTDKGCFSCGQLLKVIAEEENVMYTCSACDDVMMCQSCVCEGMHFKHRDDLKVVCLLNET